MNNWKISLDRYLTEPPDDEFDGWAEDVINNIQEEFYTKNEDWVNENNGQCNKFINELWNRGKSPEDASKMLERTFKLYKLCGA